MEEWKNIIGYEGLYEVSDKGNVRNVRRNTLLKLQKNQGYIRVALSKNGIKTWLRVHRLVAQAFLPNPDNLPEINHKNEDKTNNRVDNLEWCDRKYNNNYGDRLEKSINTKIKNGYVNEENVGLSKKEYEKKRYQENKDKRKDSQRKYYQKNKDRICERQKEYSQKNKEKIREYHHQYYLKKKEENIQNNVKSLND